MRRMELRKAVLGLLIMGFGLVCQAQTVNRADVTIARDAYGVPHIFGKTDADAAYGLAWATAEDDFESMQHSLLAARGMLGRVQGTKGVIFDFAVKFLKIDSLVNARFETDLPPDYIKMITGFVEGVNHYAETHPREVLIKKVFPVTPKDVVKGYVLTTSLMAGFGMAIKSVREQRIREIYAVNDKGSNAIAVAPDKMNDGKGYLLSNSHQPTEGQFSWYEAHVQSEEGWNITGGLFPGGSTIFVGTNENLGWAHTVNYHQFGDIYLLEINPKNKNEYKFDGKWRKFSKRKLKLVVKIAGIPIPVSRKALYSIHGPVFKSKEGVFAFKFPGYNEVRSGVQWFRMNKARNLEEFEMALKMEAVPLFNTVYADNKGNILLHSGGKVPRRDPKLDWSPPLKGDDPAFIWTDILRYEELPTVLNPACGYVFNANNTPLQATGKGCNWKGDFPGLHRFYNNRGDIFDHGLANHKGKLTESALAEMKFSTFYEHYGAYMSRFKALFELEPAKYPRLKAAIAKMNRWDLAGDIDNKDAALAMIAHDFLQKRLKGSVGLLMVLDAPISEEDAAWALKKAQKVLKKHHGSLDVPLGQVQRLIRGDKSLPIDGLREVPRASDTKRQRKGIYRVVGGDGFQQVVRFSPEGPEIKSIITYGSSTHLESPHATDQMEMFVNHAYKPVTLSKSEILQNAEETYHPGERKKQAGR